MSLLSEAMLGVTGVIRPRPDEATIGAADELVEQLRARVARWIGGRDVKPWTPPPGQGFATPEALLQRLEFTPEQPEGVELLGDEVLAAEWAAELTDAREQLVAAWPAVPMRGGLEPENVPLAADRTQDWLSLVAVVEDPRRMLLELESGAALPAQMTMFASVYPDLAADLAEHAFRAVVELQVKKRELPPAKDRCVRLLLGTPPDEPIIVPPPEEPPPEKPKSGKVEDTRTVAQKAGT